jgi:hypothetical protein
LGNNLWSESHCKKIGETSLVICPESRDTASKFYYRPKMKPQRDQPEAVFMTTMRKDELKWLAALRMPPRWITVHCPQIQPKKPMCFSPGKRGFATSRDL